MLRRLIPTLALALMFGLSQQGAVLHELSHLDDINPSSQRQDKDGKAPHSHFCEKCVSFSALTGAVGVHYVAPSLLATSFESCGYRSSSYSALTFLSYAARAPPAFS
jgi:hypothetical protein